MKTPEEKLRERILASLAECRAPVHYLDLWAKVTPRFRSDAVATVGTGPAEIWREAQAAGLVIDRDGFVVAS